jgi:hypothetical protein
MEALKKASKIIADGSCCPISTFSSGISEKTTLCFVWPCFGK